MPMAYTHILCNREPKSALPLLSISHPDTTSGSAEAEVSVEIRTGGEEGQESVQVVGLRQREPFCQLKCEVGSCKELQCCDE